MRWLLILFVFLANPAAAALLSVRVLDNAGKPVRDAVVTLRPTGRPPLPPKPSVTATIEQRNLQFHPFVTVVPVGATVAFPNFDSTRHHVYSFSAAKRFEFKLFAKDQSRTIEVDRPGVIAVGCNIHDQMSAFVFVTDTPWTARTDAGGTVTFRDAPAGSATLGVWHPNSRAPNGALERPIELGSAARNETISIRLRPPTPHDMGGY